MKNTIEIKGYIANLGKYNEGEIMGEWVTFPIDEEEKEALFERIGINEFYEETIFLDWDDSYGFKEYTSIDTINEYAEALQEWDADTFNAALELWSVNDILNFNPDDCYLIDAHTDEDLGRYFAEELGCIDIPEHLCYYFDYEAYGRDIRLCDEGGFTRYGYLQVC